MMLNAFLESLSPSLHLMFECPELRPVTYSLSALASVRGVSNDIVERFVNRMQHYSSMMDFEAWDSMISKQFVLLCHDLTHRGRTANEQLDHRVRQIFEKQVSAVEQRKALDESELLELRHVMSTAGTYKMTNHQRAAHEYYSKSLNYTKTRLDELHDSEWKCRECGVLLVDSGKQTIHHQTYHRPGAERLGFDIVALCPDCHAGRHGS